MGVTNYLLTGMILQVSHPLDIQANTVDASEIRVYHSPVDVGSEHPIIYLGVLAPSQVGNFCCRSSNEPSTSYLVRSAPVFEVRILGRSKVIPNMGT